jgi:glycopeptide antibiotics resistance protein
VGAILAATIPPDAGSDLVSAGSGRCDVDGAWLAPLGRYLRPSEDSLNVLLFVPLGIALGLLPRSRRTTVLIVATFALTLAIEATQSFVPAIRRGCEISDVVNNTLGLIVGLVVGAVFAALSRMNRGRPASPMGL